MITKRMSRIIRNTIFAEGGDLTWTNRLNDKGEETLGGISRRWHPALLLWERLDDFKRMFPENFLGEGPVYLLNVVAVDSGAAMTVVYDLLDAIEYDVFKFFEIEGELTSSVHTDDISSDRIAEKLYDLKVNGGEAMFRQCVRAIQHDLCMVVDGILGPNTLEALNSCAPEPMMGILDEAEATIDETDLMIVITKAQMHRYVDIVKEDTSQLENLSGWVNRAFKGIE